MTTSAPARRRTWALWGVAAGVLGAIGTVGTDVRPDGKRDGSSLVTAADIADLSRATYHVGVVAGYLAVAALLVFAGVWRRWSDDALPRSAAARVVGNGVVAGAGALALGYGFKGAMAVYLPGGSDHGGYDDQGLFVYYMLNDFGSYVGWLPIMVGAGAVAWLGLVSRAVPRWVGAWSVLALLPPVVLLLATGLPGFPGVVGGVWLTVASLGIAFSRPAASVPR
ncbi:hypothetical protein GON03_12750 [Nocardioides sp. MAH-18]|uniref:DUF4386 family protein n=1 Tax=Nocardioides agri TaxID=2682843 RepID=A0A6L6XRM6_9ACTN|nr:MULTISPECIES: hypothetical protein [unclassified Nocardioides]MBA2955200.1 hypothetical protein [Nocardioides sp. CGMCC 1.13656]MVQ50051.1 hypothetical protein [Nocardioides sp. MAH-18]